MAAAPPPGGHAANKMITVPAHQRRAQAELTTLASTSMELEGHQISRSIKAQHDSSLHSSFSRFQQKKTSRKFQRVRPPDRVIGSTVELRGSAEEPSVHTRLLKVLNTLWSSPGTEQADPPDP